MTDTMVLPKTVARRNQSQSTNRSLNLNLVGTDSFTLSGAFLDIDNNFNFFDDIELGSLSDDLLSSDELMHTDTEGYTTADDTATEEVDTGAAVEHSELELEPMNKRENTYNDPCDIPIEIKRKKAKREEVEINHYMSQEDEDEILSRIHEDEPQDDEGLSSLNSARRISMYPEDEPPSSTAIADGSSSDVAPIRCAMAKLADSIQRTTQSRNSLLLLRQQEMQAAMQRRRNYMPIKPSSMSRLSSESSVSSHPTVVTVDSSSQCQSQRNSNMYRSSDEYKRMCSFYAPRRTSQHAQANHHNMHQRQPPPRRNNQQQIHAHQQQQSANQSAAYAAVVAISKPHPETLINHADFATGRRSTLTDSLDESRSKLVTIARQTGVGLMTAGTMAKWSVAARTTQGFY